MKTILTLLAVLWAGTIVQAQSYTDKINREFAFEKKGTATTLMVDNINGAIHIEAYDGDKISVEVVRSISAKSAAWLEEGKKKIQLGALQQQDTLILFTEGTCGTYGQNKNNTNRKLATGGWGYQHCNDCRETFDYRLDFVIRVPKSVNLYMSTINNGDITVENTNGAVRVNNINGSIKLLNLTSEVRASTINGDLDVTYARNPSQDCRFYALNGTINALFQKGLAANMSFESFNGELFTNIDRLEALPASVEKESKKDGIKYKINDSRFKIGAGGKLLDFETFNGNVYLKEI